MWNVLLPMQAHWNQADDCAGEGWEPPAKYPPPQKFVDEYERLVTESGRAIDVPITACSSPVGCATGAAAVPPTTGATCNADGSGGACDDDDHDDELSDDDDEGTSMVIETDGRQRKRPRRL